MEDLIRFESFAQTEFKPLKADVETLKKDVHKLKDDVGMLKGGFMELKVGGRLGFLFAKRLKKIRLVDAGAG